MQKLKVGDVVKVKASVNKPSGSVGGVMVYECKEVNVSKDEEKNIIYIFSLIEGQIGDKIYPAGMTVTESHNSIENSFDCGNVKITKGSIIVPKKDKTKIEKYVVSLDDDEQEQEQEEIEEEEIEEKPKAPKRTNKYKKKQYDQDFKAARGSGVIDVGF